MRAPFSRHWAEAWPVGHLRLDLIWLAFTLSLSTIVARFSPDLILTMLVGAPAYWFISKGYKSNTPFSLLEFLLLAFTAGVVKAILRFNEHGGLENALCIPASVALLIWTRYRCLQLARPSALSEARRAPFARLD